MLQCSIMLVFRCGWASVIDCICRHCQCVRIVFSLPWVCFCFSTYVVCACSLRSFGKQLGGRRGCECITLEPSEMIVVSTVALSLFSAPSLCLCLSTKHLPFILSHLCPLILFLFFHLYLISVSSFFPLYSSFFSFLSSLALFLSVSAMSVLHLCALM